MCGLGIKKAPGTVPKAGTLRPKGNRIGGPQNPEGESIHRRWPQEKLWPSGRDMASPRLCHCFGRLRRA